MTTQDYCMETQEAVGYFVEDIDIKDEPFDYDDRSKEVIDLEDEESTLMYSYDSYSPNNEDQPSNLNSIQGNDESPFYVYESNGNDLERSTDLDVYAVEESEEIDIESFSNGEQVSLLYKGEDSCSSEVIDLTDDITAIKDEEPPRYTGYILWKKEMSSHIGFLDSPSKDASTQVVSHDFDAVWESFPEMIKKEYEQRALELNQLNKLSVKKTIAHVLPSNRTVTEEATNCLDSINHATSRKNDSYSSVNTTSKQNRREIGQKMYEDKIPDIMNSLDTRLLIKEVKMREMLWNKRNESFKDQVLKLSSWMQVCSALIQNFYDLEPIEKNTIGVAVQMKWKKLLKLHIRYLKSKSPLLHNAIHRDLSFVDCLIESNNTTPSTIQSGDGRNHRNNDINQDSTDVATTLQHCDEINLLNTRLIELIQINNKNKNNETEKFLRTLVPYMKDFNSTSKMQFRIDVLQLIHKLETSINHK